MQRNDEYYAVWTGKGCSFMTLGDIYIVRSGKFVDDFGHEHPRKDENAAWYYERLFRLEDKEHDRK